MFRSSRLAPQFADDKADAGKNQHDENHAHPHTGFKDVADDLTTPSISVESRISRSSSTRIGISFSAHMRCKAEAAPIHLIIQNAAIAAPPSTPVTRVFTTSYWPPGLQAATLKAFHAGEIPYVFNVIPPTREAGYIYPKRSARVANETSSTSREASHPAPCACATLCS